jgi:exosortase
MTSAPEPNETADYRPMISTLRPWLLAVLTFGYLWFTLINQLRPEWSSNPQYSYGWIVPILCLGLLWRRLEDGQKDHAASTLRPPSAGDTTTSPTDQRSTINNPQTPAGHVSSRPWTRSLVVFLFALCTLLFLPARVLQAADPAWRLVDWLLAIDVVGLTLCGLYLVGGGTWLRRYAFPICFFLVAVPWLYPIEKWLIEQLTFGASALTVEVVGVLGVPALAHGKVIEVGTGVVGLDEACSGIRSFQSSLMISLFLGALYGLPGWRRVLLVPFGFVVSFVFNVCRTSFLTWIAARKGVAAIAGYHDQAGVTILLACTISIWMLALLLRKPGTRIAAWADAAREGTPRPQLSDPGSLVISNDLARRWAVVSSLSLVLLLWLIVVEGVVVVWSRSGAAVAGNAARWSVTWPVENSTFKRIEPDKEASKLLQYDEAQQGQWSEATGITWNVFYFNWLPGQVGAYLAANRHSPEICMTYAGWEMRSGPDRLVVEVKNLHLPFRCYSFAQGKTSLHVFHCRWEPAFESNPSLLAEQGRGTTQRGFRGLSTLWSGKGKGGQKILEVIVQGCETQDEAQVALLRQLETLIKVDETTGLSGL